MHSVGSKWLDRAADQKIFFVELVETSIVAAYGALAHEVEDRVMPRSTTVVTEHTLTWLSVSEGLRQSVQASFPIMPRTASWCVRWLVRE